MPPLDEALRALDHIAKAADDPLPATLREASDYAARAAQEVRASLTPRRPFGDLGGAPPQPVHLQGGIVILQPYGCTHCGNGFWTEDDPERRLPPGAHPCPHCGAVSEVVGAEA